MSDFLFVCVREFSYHAIMCHYCIPFSILNSVRWSQKKNPHHPLLSKIQQTNVTIVFPGKPSCHHQIVGSLQPLKLVSITKRPTNRFVEEINLSPCNLIPNSNPILIASTFTASKNPIIWTKTQSSYSFISLWQPNLDQISALLWDTVIYHCIFRPL